MYRSTQTSRKYSLVLFAAAFAIAASTVAPGAPPAASTPDSDSQGAGVLAEVVVTAQRKEENLQRVPIAVTALDNSTLEARNIVSPEKLQYAAPGLTYSQFAPGQAMLSIRAISSNDDGPAMDSSVGIFVDDVFIGRQTAANFEIFDIDQLEILRGPQGTLFGRNTIGGAINIRTVQPSLERAMGRLQATYGNYDTTEVAGFGSIPFSDTVAAKVSFKARRSDGWQRNVLTDKRAGAEEMTTVRAQLLFKPGDALDVTLSGNYLHDNDDEMAGRIPYRDNPGSTIVEEFLALGGRYADRTLNVTPNFTRRDMYGASVKANFHMEAGTFTSVTAYQKTDLNYQMDAIGVPSWAVNDVIDDVSDSTSQEFRFASSYSGPFNFVAGAFGYRESVKRDEVYDFFAISFPQTTGKARTNSYAVFGQGTYQISDLLTFTAGARYTHDKKDWDASGVPGFIIIAEAFSASASKSWDNFSPKLALTYEVRPDVFTYVSASTGYKSGGFGGSPGRAEEAVTPVRPEKARTYEVGVRADTLGKRLRLNATGFYTDYRDLQVVRFGPPLDGSNPFGVFNTINAKRARIHGLEFETTAVITASASIVANYAYTDAEFTDFLFPGPVPVQLDGYNLLRTPKNKLSIAGDYSIPAPGGLLQTHVTFTHLDRQNDELQPDTSAPALIKPGYNLVDAFISYEHSASGVYVKLWGDNLTDKVYAKNIYNIGPGQIAAFGDPRTYGITVGKTF